MHGGLSLSIRCESATREFPGPARIQSMRLPSRAKRAAHTFSPFGLVEVQEDGRSDHLLKQAGRDNSRFQSRSTHHTVVRSDYGVRPASELHAATEHKSMPLRALPN